MQLFFLSPISIFVQVLPGQDLDRLAGSGTTMAMPYGQTNHQQYPVANGMVSPDNTQPHIIQIRIKIPDKDVTVSICLIIFSVCMSVCVLGKKHFTPEEK